MVPKENDTWKSLVAQIAKETDAERLKRIASVASEGSDREHHQGSEAQLLTTLKPGTKVPTTSPLTGTAVVAIHRDWSEHGRVSI
jgi:hypothetical protein